MRVASDSLGIICECISANSNITSKSNFSSSFSVYNRATWRIRGGDGYRFIGQLEDIDLEVREGMPECGLYERRKRGKLYNCHKFVSVDS